MKRSHAVASAVMMMLAFAYGGPGCQKKTDAGPGPELREPVAAEEPGLDGPKVALESGEPNKGDKVGAVIPNRWSDAASAPVTQKGSAPRTGARPTVRRVDVMKRIATTEAAPTRAELAGKPKPGKGLDTTAVKPGPTDARSTTKKAAPTTGDKKDPKAAGNKVPTPKPRPPVGEVPKSECAAACTHAQKITLKDLPAETTRATRNEIERTFMRDCTPACVKRATKQSVKCVNGAKTAQDLADCKM